MFKRLLQRILIGSLAVMLIVIMVWDRGDRDVSTDRKIRVRFWTATGQKEDFPFAVNKFNERQDRIRVVRTLIPWQEHEKKILTAILSGDPPELVGQFIPVVKWASRGALLPLDAYIARDQFELEQFFPALIKEMKWQGHIFALPLATTSYGLFYNRRMFREAGLDPDKPPQNWEQVLEYSKKLTKRDESGRYVKVGFIPFYRATAATSQQTAPSAILMAFQLGASFISGDGATVSLTNPALIRSVNWVKGYYDTHSRENLAAFMAGFGYGDQHAFVSEKVGMMILANTFPEHIETYKPDLDYSVTLIPAFEGHPTASRSGSFWLGIPRGSKNPDAAWEFIKFRMSREIQLGHAQAVEENLIPSNRLAAIDPAILNGGWNRVFVKQLEFAYSAAVVPMAHEVFWREIYGAVERAVSGLQSPRAALQQAEGHIQRELDRALDYDRFVRSKVHFFGTN
jgi:ABC-type glycerol-3-phosphate transport system substrate-binding protein